MRKKKKKPKHMIKTRCSDNTKTPKKAKNSCKIKCIINCCTKRMDFILEKICLEPFKNIAFFIQIPVPYL